MSIVEMSCRKRTKREQEAFDMGRELGRREAVRHGRWIPDSDKHAFSEECSVCGEGVLWEDGQLHHYNYCPHCGAKMDGEA